MNLRLAACDYANIKKNIRDPFIGEYFARVIAHYIFPVSVSKYYIMRNRYLIGLKGYHKTCLGLFCLVISTISVTEYELLNKIIYWLNGMSSNTTQISNGTKSQHFRLIAVYHFKHLQII